MYVYLIKNGKRKLRNVITSNDGRRVTVHCRQDSHCSGGHTDYYQISGWDKFPLFKLVEHTDARR